MEDTKPANGKNVKVRIADGIAWLTLNRPEKRNAINPGIVFEMVAAIDAIEMNDDAKVVVISGAGEAFSAGQDLKEYFREPDAGDPRLREKLHNANAYWQWRRLMFYPKPTIAMVNGWCFGGGYGPLFGCDLAFAADDAQFGLSDAAAEEYAHEIARADQQEPGDDDVLRKLMQDFAARGLPMTAALIRQEMARLLPAATNPT